MVGCFGRTSRFGKSQEPERNSLGIRAGKVECNLQETRLSQHSLVSSLRTLIHGTTHRPDDTVELGFRVQELIFLCIKQRYVYCSVCVFREHKKL